MAVGEGHFRRSPLENMFSPDEKSMDRAPSPGMLTSYYLLLTTSLETNLLMGILA